MRTMPSTSTELAAVVQAIRSHERFLVVTHENPDGDALGSMLALTLGLRALGKDPVMYLTGRAPLPAEYRFLSLDGAEPRGARRSRRARPARSRLRERAADR